MDTYHTSVLLKETLDLIQLTPGKLYIDGTLGGGGHAFEIVRRGGKVLGIDHDHDAIDEVRHKLNNEEFAKENLVLVKGNFKDIKRIARDNGFEKVSGILFDLGVSSHQLDQAERGFSFQRDGPLDMRMDRDLNVKASDLVNILTKGELYELFYKLAEERFARTIADSIVRSRRIGPIKTTKELADIVGRVVPHKRDQINPATRIFQALRIVVNDELNNLREVLPNALGLLDTRGRLAVISFHSLEDRIVKHQFKDWAKLGAGQVITPKPVTASEEEIERNKRSRSAKLRVFENL